MKLFFRSFIILKGFRDIADCEISDTLTDIDNIPKASKSNLSAFISIIKRYIIDNEAKFWASAAGNHFWN